MKIVKIVNSAWKGRMGIPDIEKIGPATAEVGWQGAAGLTDAVVKTDSSDLHVRSEKVVVTVSGINDLEE